jgi:hypothetical protein
MNRHKISEVTKAFNKIKNYVRKVRTLANLFEKC